MAIVGFNFTKISAEKTGPIRGKVEIKQNAKMTKVESQKLAVGSLKEEGIKFTYEFILTYEPKIARLKFEGEILAIEGKENVKKILDEWKKSKQLPPALMAQLLNMIFPKCNIKAMVLSQDINIPSPVPLPKVQTGAKKVAK